MEVLKPTENMEQPILAETVGAVAEQPNANRDQDKDAFQQVLDNVAALSANPARDQSSPGGAGSGHEGQESGRCQKLRE